jgi:phenylpropionate dioxygenase-like ring-hydroxylating dioxygenase large terminal subunit
VDRIPKQRYYDKEFYALEAELFWPRVWQMACRLEEIPSRGDFVEYEILDQSVIVVRLDDDSVRAYYNACRHRGMKIVEGSGSRRSFVCPFHGWCWGLDGANTFVLRPEVFDESNLGADDLSLVPVRCELWGGCAWTTSTTAHRRCASASNRSRPSTTNGRLTRCAPSGGNRAYSR